MKDKEVQQLKVKQMAVKTYFPNKFNKHICKELLYASHWLDTSTGECIKLSPALKLVYFHRYEQYLSFTRRGCTYIESNQTISKKLCLDYDSVRQTYSNTLKAMGLLEVFGSVRKRVYKVNAVSSVKGVLINYKLNEVVKEYETVKSSYESAFTYENLKNLEYNKQQASRMMNKSDQRYHVISDSDMKNLLNRKGTQDNE